jgi:hypothetical protein
VLLSRDDHRALAAEERKMAELVLRAARVELDPDEQRRLERAARRHERNARTHDALARDTP